MPPTQRNRTSTRKELILALFDPHGLIITTHRSSIFHLSDLNKLQVKSSKDNDTNRYKIVGNGIYFNLKRQIGHNELTFGYVGRFTSMACQKKLNT